MERTRDKRGFREKRNVTDIDTLPKDVRVEITSAHYGERVF